jgi:hypothetical protein
MHWFIDTLIGGVAYDLFRYLVGPLIVTLLGTAILKYSFDKLKEKRQVLTFSVGSFLVCVVLFFFLGARAQQPDLHGEIPQVLVGPVPGTDRDTVAVVAINIINSGTMQSIVKSWKVTAQSGDNIYNGVFVQMPASFTFGNIPKTVMTQPTSITFHSEDNFAQKGIKPIEPGGEATGILFVEFPNVDQNIFRGALSFTVSYEDALSRPYSVSAKSNGQIGQVSAVSGHHTEMACPIPTDITSAIPKTPLPPRATPIPVQPH